MPIKSFRGLLADNAVETISLHTNNGSTGYRIKKFEIMGYRPGSSIQESIVKIYTVPQTAGATTTIDFSDNTLIAAGKLQQHDSSAYQFSQFVVFDNITFNQDIYVTHSDVDGSEPINYHIELEMVRLDLNENTVATLKDIRNIKSQ